MFDSTNRRPIGGNALGSMASDRRGSDGIYIHTEYNMISRSREKVSFVSLKEEKKRKSFSSVNGNTGVFSSVNKILSFSRKHSVDFTDIEVTKKKKERNERRKNETKIDKVRRIPSSLRNETRQLSLEIDRFPC